MRIIHVFLVGLACMGCTLTAGCKKEENNEARAPSDPRREELAPTSVLLLRDEIGKLRSEVGQLKNEMGEARKDLRGAHEGARPSTLPSVPLPPITPTLAVGPLQVTCAGSVRIPSGGSTLVEFLVSGRRSATSDGFRAYSFCEDANRDSAALAWDDGRERSSLWVYHRVNPEVERFFLRLHAGSKLRHDSYALLIEHQESGRNWKVDVEITGANGKSTEAVQVVVRSETQLLDGVHVHVLVDGAWKCDWPNDQREIAFTIQPGQHEIVIRSKYRDRFYRKSFTCSVPPAGVVELSVGKVDPDPEGKW